MQNSSSKDRGPD